MILKAFAVRDSAANAFMRPFFMPTSAIAVRSFRDEVNRVADDNMMYRYPSDYELFEVGAFDESTGEFAGMKPVSVVRAADLRDA